MACVVFLGPEYYFSHELAVIAFPEHKKCFRTEFEDIIESVMRRDCTIGLVPFENSNSSSIVKLQLGLYAHRRDVFVTDLLTHPIAHTLYGFGDLQTIEEVRSIEPVFAQTAVWLSKNLPGVIQNKTYSSSSASILSLKETENNIHLAAIGSKYASSYGVPVLASNIQTEPNVTVFCRIQSDRPDLENTDSALIGIEDFCDEDVKNLIEFLLVRGCAFTTNWVIQDPCVKFRIFEIISLASRFSLAEVIPALEKRLKKCFFIGAYTGINLSQLASDKYFRAN